MNTLLTVADIEYLLTQQEKLDKDIRNKFDINLPTWSLDMKLEHELALNVEIHEWINCIFKPWKYWKTKEMNMDDVLEEAIDVIHFIMLDVNKRSALAESTAKSIHETLKIYATTLKKEPEVRMWLYKLSTDEQMSTVDKLSVVLRVLDYYGFTSKDIIDAYNRKNKVNFERMAGNY